MTRQNLSVAGGQPRTQGDTQNRTCLLVLGMHRSGTSALTRVLNIAGASLPATLLGAGGSNAVGHWESVRLIRFHDTILDALGSSWNDWSKLEFSHLPVGRHPEIRTEIGNILGQEFGDAPLFVVKDPRICRFAPLFIAAVKSANLNLRVALSIRNPLEVCESLEKRNGMSRATAALLWLRHVLDAEVYSRSVPRVIVSFSDLLADWRSTLTAISDQLGLDNIYAPDEISAQVDSFLKQSLRHHSRTTEAVALDPLLGEWISAAYEAMLVLTRTPNSAKAMASLDAVAAEFNKACPFIHRLHSDTLSRLESEFPGFTLREETADGSVTTSDAEPNTSSGADGNSKGDNDASSENKQLLKKLKDRIDEIAKLSRIVRQKEHQAELVRLAAARQVSRTIAAFLRIKEPPRLWGRLRQEYQVFQLKRSGLFDPAWYLQRYEDVAQLGMDPARHYVKFGAREGREPNPALADAVEKSTK